MATNDRTRLISVLVEEFIEERVRQHPKRAFTLDDAKRALRDALTDGDVGVELSAQDDKLLESVLDRHPFMVRGGGGSKPSWTPGLDRKTGTGPR